MLGSSPLTRGKRPGSSRVRPSSGLIPAHAGKTSRSLRLACRLSAHPRSRGENCRAKTVAGGFRGSSPLTRGKRLRVLDAEGEFGLIPAHAGKTTTCPAARPAGRAHPRSRGENGIPGFCSTWIVGSSPLTRGKPPERATHKPPPRLIPAHAGKTRSPRLRADRSRAHPRSRGENSRLPNRDFHA